MNHEVLIYAQNNKHEKSTFYLCYTKTILNINKFNNIYMFEIKCVKLLLKNS